MEFPAYLVDNILQVEPESESVSIATYFNDVCRLCLNKGELKMITNLEGDFITTVIGFMEVVLDRKLPESLCKPCFKELTQMASFIRKCKHSQNILQQIEEECAKVQAASGVQIEILSFDDNANDFVLNAEDVKVELEETKMDSGETQIDDDNFYLYEEKLSDYISPLEETFPIADNLDMESNEREIVTSENVIVDHVVEADDLKICEKCGEIVVTMKDHYKMSKSCQPKNIKCTECDMSFSKNERLKGHKVAHHWKETFQRYMCHICSKMFKYEVNLKRHIEVHEGKRFVCEICNKSYTTKIGLQDHVNIHTGDKPFACCFCDKQFSMRSVRNLHQRKHTVHPIYFKKEKSEDLEPVMCDICNKPFTHLRALNLHKMSHDENRIFTCHTCHLAFPSKLLLLRHYATHKEKKLYQCSYCKKSFKIRSYLATHIRSHTGERPFACTECPKSFTQMAHLSYHMLLHTNEKSFVCKYCGKSFTLKGNLTVHLRIHTGERPYKCHVCGQGFRDSSGRKRHVIARHGEEQVAYIKSVDINET